MKRGIKMFDYIFVIRPTLLFPVWTVYLGGHAAQSQFGQSISRISWQGLWNFDYLLGGMLLTFCMGAAFVLNQLSDVQSDHYNNKLYLIAHGDIGRNEAIIESLILTLPALLLGFLLKVSFGIALTCCVLVAGILYSCRPFLFKDHPHAGFLCNGAGALVVFIAGWLIRGDSELMMWLHVLPYVFALWSLFFFTTLPDREGDRKAGKITVGVKYGVHFCINCALFFNVATIVTAYVLKNYYILIPALLTLPLFIHTAIRRRLEDGVRTTKFGLLCVALAFCYRFPGFLLLLVLVFFASKWYYKKRFGINYPSFETQ